MKRVWLCGVLLVAFIGVVSAKDTIDVYTTSYLPLKNTAHHKATLWWLDRPDEPLAALSRGLPDTYEKAKPAAVARIHSAEGRRLLGDLQQAYQGIIRAWRLGLTDLPAVVVDGHYVVYGVYDLDEALLMIDRHRKREQ